MAVFVLDKSKQPLMPCSEKRARKLLQSGRARVHRRFPFSIRMVDRKRSDCGLQPLKMKLDLGRIAVVRESETVDPEGEVKNIVNVVTRIELTHRDRAPRFLNRTKPVGWLAPSLQHRVDTTRAWVDRLQRLAPIDAIAQELVRFDMQKMENPEISGAEYQ